LIVLDSLLIGGLRFVLGKIAAAVEAELTDDSTLREELLAAQMRLELGEISRAEYVELERVLLRQIDEVRRRTRGESESPGALRVTGIEATFTGEEHAGEEHAGDARLRRSRRR
jgi:hypothetical protein